MEEMKFKSLQRGDLVFTLERDRRSMYPIFDRAKVVKVGESKPRANENGDGFSNLIEIVLQDSIGTVTVYLPSDGNEGIYNNVYYTLIGSNIVNEVSLQRSQALGIINNVGKYENIIKECDNILAMFENKEPTNGSQFNEEFASFRKDVVSVLQSQQQAINLMMDSLGLNKPKEIQMASKSVNITISTPLGDLQIYTDPKEQARAERLIAETPSIMRNAYDRATEKFGNQLLRLVKNA